MSVAHSDVVRPRERILLAARDLFHRYGIRGVGVELTADDHPGRRIIEELKTEHRNRLASLCRRAGISQPEVLADTLTLLLEGARVSRQAAGSKGPSAKFTATAEAVIATFQSRTKVSPKSGVRKRTK